MEDDFARDGACPPVCRRVYKRIELDGSGIISSEGEKERVVAVKNVSAKGAAIIADFPLEEGKRQRISIRSPLLRNSVDKEARVVWCKRIAQDAWQAGLALQLNDTIEFV